MDGIFDRFFGNLSDRVTGPLAFRLALQPLMATILAARDGIRDARENRTPYGWALLTECRGRKEHLKRGWSSIRNVFLFALTIDVVYQLLVLGWIYPGEALAAAALLALAPYAAMRGLINRAARAFVHRRDGSPGI